MSNEFSVYNISNKRILIKTFLFESGLWYLAKSHGDILSANGNYVWYIPKAKYSSVGGSFKRGYPDPRNKSEFSDINIENFSEKAPVGSQILRAVKRHNADLIISFETLMQTGQWINEIKNKTGVEVYHALFFAAADRLRDLFVLLFTDELFDDGVHLHELDCRDSVHILTDGGQEFLADDRSKVEF